MHRARLSFLAVVTGYFLVMYAVAPVSVVMPTLAASFGVGVEEASWVMSAYLLALTACLLPAGRLGDIYGHRRLFILGIAVGAAAALVAGLAPVFPVLLGARAVQGISAALVSATSLPIITAAVAEAKRGRSIGLVTMSSSFGAMAGTGLAPLFVQFLDWRWAFLSAALLGVPALALAMQLGGETHRASSRRLDWPGAILLLLTLSVASLSLNHLHDGPETFAGGWHWHLPMHLAALVLLGMFIVVERRVPAPLVQFGQFANGKFSTAIGANGVLHMTMMFAVFSMPFFIERGLRLSPIETGVLLTTMQGCTTAMTLAGGWLYDRTRSNLLSPGALAMVASGLLALGLAGDALDYGRAFTIIVWMGVGSGCFMTVNNTRIMSALGAEYRGFASGMLETSRQYGHTLGVAVAATGLAAATVPGLSEVASDAALRQGFSQSALVMSAIAWLGVLCAAYPMKRRVVSALALTRLVRPAIAERSR